MIRIFSILFILASAMTACNNNSKEEKGPEIDSAGIAARKTAKETNEQIMDILQNLAPLTEEQLKLLIPETVMETPLSNYSFNDGQGAAMVSGEYKINDSTSLSLDIYDCSGAGGAGLYTLRFAGNLDYNNDNPTEYTKVIDFNGGKAIEYCLKTNVECSLTYFSGGRFLVVLKGNNLNADRLKDLAQHLKIK